MSESPLVGRALAVARVGAGLSRAELAERLGLSTRQLWRWEHGSEPVEPASLARIAEPLGLDAAEIQEITELLERAAARRSSPPRVSSLSGLSKPEGTPLTPAERRQRAAELLAEVAAILGKRPDSPTTDS